MKGSCPTTQNGTPVPVSNCVIRAISRVLQKAKARDYASKYQKEHRTEINERMRDMRKNNPAWRAEVNLRSRLADYARTNGFLKKQSTEVLLQCSWEEFAAHLERLDADYGNREIDHVFPMSMFRLEQESEQRKCMHFTNLQPLTLIENRDKYNKLPTKAMAARVDPGCWPDGVTEDMLPDVYPGWTTPLRM